MSAWCNATVVPSKGLVQWAVEWALRSLRAEGQQRFLLKTDAEPVIETVKALCAQHHARGSHSSIGVIERWHQDLQGQVKALVSELSMRLGGRGVEVGSPVHGLSGVALSTVPAVQRRDLEAASKTSSRVFVGYWLGKTEVLLLAALLGRNKAGWQEKSVELPEAEGAAGHQVARADPVIPVPMVIPGRPPDEDDVRSARHMREALRPTAGCPACVLIAREWAAKELQKLDGLGTFERLTGEAAAEYRCIPTWFVYDVIKSKARLVLQDIRRGATRPEDFSPTPSLTGLRTCLLAANAGRMLLAKGPWSRGRRRKRSAILGSEVTVRSSPSTFGLGENSRGDFEFDPGVFHRGTGSSMSYCVVHFDDVIVLGTHQERDRVMSTWRSDCKLKHEFSFGKIGDRVKLLGRWLLKTQRGLALCNDAKYAAQLQTLVGLRGDSKGCLVPLTATDRNQPSGKELSLSTDRPGLTLCGDFASKRSTEAGDSRLVQTEKVVRYLVEQESVPLHAHTDSKVVKKCSVQAKLSCIKWQGWLILPIWSPHR
eukprot:2698746-Amphidinium_carterae.2